MIMNTLILALAMCISHSFRMVEADIGAAELDFYQYYQKSKIKLIILLSFEFSHSRPAPAISDEDTVKWRAFQQIFCEFIGPVNFTLTSVQVVKKPLQFATIDAKEIRVEMLYCSYNDVNLNFISAWYAQSPSGKFYEMNGTAGGDYFENFGIVDEIEAPPASVEQAFRDHYAGKLATKKSFCTPKCF